mmetsp:Transcript_36085/g.90048  ORF Transcript_36085/g.90048 Transcript_36085/m.90048 type:complete len:293 (-) Transcript_36085:54-932(-)
MAMSRGGQGGFLLLLASALLRLRAALLPEALNGGQDGAAAILGAPPARHRKPREPLLVHQFARPIPGHEPVPSPKRLCPGSGLPAVFFDAALAGVGVAAGGASQRLGVDKIYERANLGAVVELELVLERAVAHVLGHVERESSLGRLEDVEHVVVVPSLPLVDPWPVERELHLIVRALLLPQLVRPDFVGLPVGVSPLDEAVGVGRSNRAWHQSRGVLLRGSGGGALATAPGVPGTLASFPRRALLRHLREPGSVWNSTVETPQRRALSTDWRRAGPEAARALLVVPVPVLE